MESIIIRYNKSVESLLFERFPLLLFVCGTVYAYRDSAIVSMLNQVISTLIP